MVEEAVVTFPTRCTACRQPVTVTYMSEAPKGVPPYLATQRVNNYPCPHCETENFLGLPGQLMYAFAGHGPEPRNN